MQGCLWSRPPSDAERFIYVEDGKAVLVEAMEKFRILLETGVYLDLNETFVAPSFRWSIISIPIFDKSSYFCSLRNNKVSLFHDSKHIGTSSLIDYLYMFALLPLINLLT